MLGCHTIKHWSSTQTSVALSSGEAEFAGVIRGAGQGLGYQALLKDLGIEAPLRVWTDSSAAIGICSRQGLGKLRHLDTHTLWIQQAVRLGRVDLRKVDGEVNPADLLTKHSLSRERLEALVRLHGCEYIGGRADSAPKARDGASGKTTMASANSGSVVVGALDGLERQPVMPHNDLSEHDLDLAYPSIVAPEDDHLDDIVNDNEDHVLQAGLREVEKIRQTMRTQGRRRRPLREIPTHGTLSLCVEEAAVAVRTTEIGTVEVQRTDGSEQACAERASNAFGNYVASAHEECGVSRVGRLAIVGGAWLRQTRDNAGAEACLSTATISKLTLGLASQGGLQTRHHPVPARTCQQRRRAPRLQPELEQSAPAAPWLDLRQACRSGCPTKAGVPNTHKKVATSTGKPVIPVPAASAARILRRVLRPSSGATTCSTHCRRRSVWQDDLPDTATSTTTTGSDQLIGQRHGVDVGKCDGRFAESDGAPFGIHSCHLLSCCYRCFVSDLGPMLLSGSSALFCET